MAHGGPMSITQGALAEAVGTEKAYFSWDG